MKKGSFVLVGLLILLAMSFTACDNPMDGYASAPTPNSPTFLERPPARIAVPGGKTYELISDVRLRGIGTLYVDWSTTTFPFPGTIAGQDIMWTDFTSNSGRGRSPKTDMNFTPAIYSFPSGNRNAGNVTANYTIRAYNRVKTGTLGSTEVFAYSANQTRTTTIKWVNTDAYTDIGFYSYTSIEEGPEVSGGGTNTVISFTLNNGAERMKLYTTGTPGRSPYIPNFDEWEDRVPGDVWGYGLIGTNINIIDGEDLFEPGSLKIRCLDPDTYEWNANTQYGMPDTIWLHEKSKYELSGNAIRSGTVTFQLYGDNLNPEIYELEVKLDE